MNNLTESTDLSFSVQIDVCYESMPCQHWVTFKDDTTKMLNGIEICELYKNANLPIPDHFAPYNNLDINSILK